MMGLIGIGPLAAAARNSLSDQRSQTGSAVAISSRTFVSKNIIPRRGSASSHPGFSFREWLRRGRVGASFPRLEAYLDAGEGSPASKPVAPLAELVIFRSRLRSRQYCSWLKQR